MSRYVMCDFSGIGSRWWIKLMLLLVITINLCMQIKILGVAQVTCMMVIGGRTLS